MKRIILFAACLALLMLPGCATTTATSQQAALENVLLALAGQATGVYLGGGTCTPPAIPPELLNPCAPQPASATPQQLQDALTNCIVNSVALVAVTKYSQRVCTPTTAVKSP